MTISLSKWGNSAAIRIPKTMLEQLNIDDSNFDQISFRVEIDNKQIILKKEQGKSKFEMLAEKSLGEKLNPKIDLDWGESVGKEVW